MILPNHVRFTGSFLQWFLEWEIIFSSDQNNEDKDSCKVEKVFRVVMSVRINLAYFLFFFRSTLKIQRLDWAICCLFLSIWTQAQT